MLLVVVGALVFVVVAAMVIALVVGETVHRRRRPSADKEHGGFRLDL